jgi:hypothetical protein
MGLATDYDTLGTQSSKTLASVLELYANLDSKRQSVAKRRSLAQNIAIRFREAQTVVCCLCWGPSFTQVFRKDSCGQLCMSMTAKEKAREPSRRTHVSMYNCDMQPMLLMHPT